MTYSLEEKVRNFAILSRVAVMVLQSLANYYIPDHDAAVFQKAPDPLEPTPLDNFLDPVLSGFKRWDAQYFLHIAQYGYTYENTLAFFPLFPILMRYLGHSAFLIVNTFLEWFTPFTYMFTLETYLSAISVIINNYLFVKTSVVLYRLSLAALKNSKLAYIAAIMFCVNPASIFFSAIYSESLFCFLTFTGMLKIEEKNALVNYVIMGLSAAVRSNGLLNLGFLVHKYIKLKINSKLSTFQNIIFNWGIVLSLLPFLSYQLFCYATYCIPGEVVFPSTVCKHGAENDFVYPKSNSSWCDEPVPFAYAYVQKHYWNVGFLSYYQFKQIPNFLLASPMVYIVARGTLSFVRRHKDLILHLGFVAKDDLTSDDDLPVSIFPYVLHGAVLTAFGVLVINVQVVTRLLASSSPLVYWFCARTLSPSLTDSVEAQVLEKLPPKGKKASYNESSDNKKSWWKTFIFTENFTGYPFFIRSYFMFYFVVGTCMFSNYLPWT